ncbi:tRNA (N6-threonylcarbamoyladenosine(37)-N6)-methyltransferase TrmO [bacterium]|nr:tRNA (N6-threonylcarbamoyladenosine(37)-N6)-methyltransferase TrmO [bacterium]
MSDVKEFHLRAIGTIHTPFTKQKGTPIQPPMAKDAQGTIEILPEYCAGLKDLAGFERIWLLYCFHLTSGFKLEVVPYLDQEKRGLFATRAPTRPNPLGLSCVRLLSVDAAAGLLRIRDADMLDGSPLLDIKPYISRFDAFPDARLGWLENVVNVSNKKADNRFSDK